MYCTVTKHSGHLRTLEKCRKKQAAVEVFSAFPSCSQMLAVFYHSVIQGEKFGTLACAVQLTLRMSA